MIKIVDKIQCCGCAACVQACPKECISFDEDRQGFRYPLVDESHCIDCGLCEKVCPVINQANPQKPLSVYAAMNPNEQIRLKSSSGGVFTKLAEAIIDNGGVVFGARFNANWEVEHGYTETKEGLASFRGSKYVQSRIGDTFRQARDFLKAGRQVLYSGTSCQIAGLKRFLRRDYENLLTVDIVCHGVPSPLVWRTYLEDVQSQPKKHSKYKTDNNSSKSRSVITSISFRDKTYGWKNYSVVFKGLSGINVDEALSSSVKDDVLLQDVFVKNRFMQVFLKDLCLRPSCSACPAKSGKSGSDITLADFWGIDAVHPDWDDDKGTSLVLIKSDCGIKIWNQIDLKFIPTSYEEGLCSNPSIEKSVKFGKHVPVFWHLFESNDEKGLTRLLNQLRPSFIHKQISYIKGMIVKLLRLMHLK